MKCLTTFSEAVGPGFIFERVSSHRLLHAFSFLSPSLDKFTHSHGFAREGFLNELADPCFYFV